MRIGVNKKHEIEFFSRSVYAKMKICAVRTTKGPFKFFIFLFAAQLYSKFEIPQVNRIQFSLKKTFLFLEYA